jgi:hypothetical protein
MNDEPKPRRCARCNWVIGIIRRSASRVTTLSVFTETVQEMPTIITDDLFAMSNVVQGEAHCKHCGCINPWHYSQRALEELLERRIKRTFGLEVQND